MPVSLAQIRSELLPGLFDVRGSYDMIPRQWDKVFKTHKSNMAVERSTQMAFVSLPFLKDEGAATQFDNQAGERWTWAFVHIEVALGYAIPIHVDEKVITDKGKVRLGDICAGDMVLTRRGRFRPVSAVHKQGVIPTVNVRTTAGRVVRTSPVHTFLTHRGWVEAGNLTPDDMVAVGRVGCDYDTKKYAPSWLSNLREKAIRDISRERGGVVIAEADEKIEVTAQWEVVSSVESAPDGECRCLTVEEDSSFTAGGLVVHNTRKAIDDNLYKAQFNPTNLKLQEAFAQFKEIQAANILNNGQTYQTSIVGDGVALFSTAHPYDGGTWANTSSTPKSLNESTLLADMTNVRVQFVNERGLRILSRARRLIVPPNLEPIAIRLTKTELRPGTADNDVNAILTLSGGLPEGFIVLDFLTSNFAWFLTTNIDGLIHMLRIPYESDMWVDNVTDNLLVKSYERYSFGYNDPRAVWGEFPTS